MATNGFLPGTFFCVSGRGQAGIGHWIAPSGDDYTLPGTHAFEVSIGGQNNPGVVEISVTGSDNRFPAGQWDGIYSCVIPDETGTEQILYLGIYIVFGMSAVKKFFLSYSHYQHHRFSTFASCSVTSSFFPRSLPLLYPKLFIKQFSSHRSYVD